MSQLLTQRWNSGPRARRRRDTALMVNGRESSGPKFVTLLESSGAVQQTNDLKGHYWGLTAKRIAKYFNN
jgi:hypothetical protein